jgi:hypothetical protein
MGETDLCGCPESATAAQGGADCAALRRRRSGLASAAAASLKELNLNQANPSDQNITGRNEAPYYRPGQNKIDVSGKGIYLEEQH